MPCTRRVQSNHGDHQRTNVLSHHKGLAFRATYQDAVARHDISGVKADVSRMLMVHHQDVSVEMSTHLQTA
jgi:hypothetical protein